METDETRGMRNRSDLMRRNRLLPWLLLLATGCASSAPDSSEPMANGRVKKYVVMLEGRNLIFAHEGEPKRFGFSTTRDVEATNPKEAEQRAIQEVREDDELNASLLNDPSNPPRITVMRYIEVHSFDSSTRHELGYIFYEDHDTR